MLVSVVVARQPARRTGHESVSVPPSVDTIRFFVFTALSESAGADRFFRAIVAVVTEDDGCAKVFLSNVATSFRTDLAVALIGGSFRYRSSNAVSVR